MRSLSLLVFYWDNLDATAVVFHLPNLDFLVLVLRFHSKARNCTLNSKWRSTSKFSLQYQCIAEPRGDENLKKWSSKRTDDTLGAFLSYIGA